MDQLKPTMVSYALALALKGLHVFPITPGEKNPPLISAWQKLATTNAEQINAWWDACPTANIGCHVGASSHVVLDVDVKNGVDGFKTLRDLKMRNAFSNVAASQLLGSYGLPPTGWNVETPSGGLHIWYKLPPGAEVGNSVGKLGDGLDVRSMNGYVLMPPSKLDNAETPYRWLPPLRSRPVTGS